MSVPNAGHLWLISNLDQKRTEFIADHVTTLSLRPDVTDVGMSSEQVQNEMAIFSKLCISDPRNMYCFFFSGMKKMEYKTRQWHEKCFVCCTCKNPIGTKSFIPKEHDIYCAKCYEDKFATKCIKCNKVNSFFFFFSLCFPFFFFFESIKGNEKCFHCKVFEVTGKIRANLSKL